MNRDPIFDDDNIVCSQIVHLRFFNTKFKIQTIKLNRKKKKICSLRNGRVTNNRLLLFSISSRLSEKLKLFLIALHFPKINNKIYDSSFLQTVFTNCHFVACIVILH